jgi:hypothetical protein
MVDGLLNGNNEQLSYHFYRSALKILIIRCVFGARVVIAHPKQKTS